MVYEVEDFCLITCNLKSLHSMYVEIKKYMFFCIQHAKKNIPGDFTLLLLLFNYTY